MPSNKPRGESESPWDVRSMGHTTTFYPPYRTFFQTAGRQKNPTTPLTVSRPPVLLLRFVGYSDFLGYGKRETASGFPVD